MAMINIDGIDLPGVPTYKTPNFDLDSEDSNRNELGYMQRDIIREDIFKLELTWKGITSSQLATIKASLKPKKFQVTFITETGPITKTMMPGDRNIEMVKYDPDYNKIRWDISCNLTEY